jgi:type I restriction enzyme S subunit
MLEVRALLLTRGNTPELVGDACIVTSTRPKLLLSDLIYRLGVRKDKLNPRFLLHTLLSNFGRSQIEADARGSSESMVKVSQSHIREWLVLLPNLCEQDQIVNRCDSMESSVSAAITKIQDGAARLREYRAALITAAVTGQLDLRKHEKQMEALA